MFKVEFTPFAEKQFFKLQLDVRDRIINVLERISINPYRSVKRKEGTSYFIMRAGDFRAVLDIDNQKRIIYILEVGHRKNIYE